MISEDSADTMVEETPTESNGTLESANTRLEMIIRNTSTVYYLLLIIFGVIGNGLVIFAYHTRAKLRVVSCNFFLVQMSQVNLIVVCLIDPLILYSMYTERRSVDVVCKIWIVIMEVCAGMTVFCIIAIAVNRYFLIVHPRLFRRLCTPKRIKTIMVFLWLFIFSVAAFVVVKIGVKRDRVTRRCMLDDSTALGRFYNNLILYCFFMPLMIVVPFAHALTLSAIRESRRRVKCQISPSNKEEVQGAKTHCHKSGGPKTTSRRVTESGDKRSTLMGMESTSSCTIKSPFRKFSIIPTDSREASRNVDKPSCSHGNRPTRDNRVILNACELPQMNPFAYKLPRENRRNTKKRELPLIRMMSLLYIVLCLSWVPWWMKNIFVDDEENNITTFMYTLAWLNPIYYSFSPFIYALSNRNFRVAYGDVFRRVVCKP